MDNMKLKIFFSGIAGSGLSAIACFMADRGHIIAGSDRVFDNTSNHPLKKIFQSKGVAIFPQDGTGLDNTCGLMVVSTAVEPGSPDFMKAKELGIPVKTRPEFLSDITKSFNTIAVSGTSGKSTVSGMLAFLMSRLGLDPNFIGGGRVKQFRSSLNPGNYLAGNSDVLVIEACESDGTIVNFRPQHTIILNLALDHHTVDETSKMFKTLIGNTTKKVMVNADDENLGKLATSDLITFSIHKSSDYTANEISFKAFGTDFSLDGVRFSLSLPGKYNLYNALSCLTLLSQIGVPLTDAAQVLPEFKGIDRRFDIYLDDGEKLVIDDYAHNPHKIASLMQSLEKIRKSICYIFQPHGFGPTRLMKEGYIETFRKNLRETDHLILLPVYYVGGTASRDISSYDLADGIKTGGRSVEVIEKRDDILRKLHEHKCYIVFGARDETLAGLAKQIAESIKPQQN